jgi:hypothetical protein
VTFLKLFQHFSLFHEDFWQVRERYFKLSLPFSTKDNLYALALVFFGGLFSLPG